MGMRWMKVNPKWIMPSNFMPTYMAKTGQMSLVPTLAQMTCGEGWVYQIID